MTFTWPKTLSDEVWTLVEGRLGPAAPAR